MVNVRLMFNPSAQYCSGKKSSHLPTAVSCSLLSSPPPTHLSSSLPSPSPAPPPSSSPPPTQQPSSAPALLPAIPIPGSSSFLLPAADAATELGAGAMRAVLLFFPSSFPTRSAPPYARRGTVLHHR
ncbi:hypothetical protein PVAP13_1KG110100 [Panicum virgatum]|uniref:Uncharacterized protein n=1 Tax=Panicum virgatum TaxID=38727 RepID=A0A8T0XJS5_PANVG|nr:hypothetical protein PVAP13_1KG110100 [Panicum virgatum]